MALSVETNLPLFKKDFDSIVGTFDERLRMARDEIAMSVEQLAKEEIKGKRGSHIGPQGGIVWDKAEAGKPPKNRTGNLRRSIKTVKSREGFGIYSADIGPTMVYSRRVEEGGGNWKAGVRFPYMEPAFRKFKESGLMQQIMTRYIGEF